METAKSLIGLVSVLLAAIVLFQSCLAAGLDEPNAGATSGIGMMMAVSLLVAGLNAIASRNNPGRALMSLLLYLLVALLPLAVRSQENYYLPWGLLSMVFTVVFAIDRIAAKRRERLSKTDK